MSRVYFPNNKDREKFFEEVKKSGKSWKEISEGIGTTRSMLDQYRFGKLYLPQGRFSSLSGLIPRGERDNFARKTKTVEGNWGQIIGGKNAYKRNKKAFDEGRKISAKSNSARHDFDINMTLNEDLCEFIGTLIGDGFTNKYNNFYQTQFTGDKILDLDYYQNKISPICKKLFGITPTISTSPRCLRANIYSKRLFEMLTKRFGIPAGKKCYSVMIPKEILDSEDKFICATLRGMFDTDGGIGFDKRKIYKKPYIRVNYTSVSHRLIDQIMELLSEYKIPASVYNKNDTSAREIQINGENNVKLFLDKIGFSNQRHLKKIKHLLN